MKKIINVVLVCCVIIAAVVLYNRTDTDKSLPQTQQTSDDSSLKETRSLNLEGVNNARQLGGYITADGRTVKEGLLLRTGRLYSLSADDIQVLVDQYHLRDIFDLRNEVEVESMPDPEIEGVTYTNVPAFSEEDYNNLSISTADGYTAGVNDYIQRRNNMFFKPQAYASFSRLLQILLEDKDGAVLFHCAQGKDRTGFAAAVILGLLNVDRETIVKDYLLSNEAYAADIQDAISDGRDAGYPEDYDVYVTMAYGVLEDDINMFLDGIDERYGSMKDFAISELGVTEEDINKLIEKYTEMK